MCCHQATDVTHLRHLLAKRYRLVEVSQVPCSSESTGHSVILAQSQVQGVVAIGGKGWGLNLFRVNLINAASVITTVCCTVSLTLLTAEPAMAGFAGPAWPTAVLQNLVRFKWNNLGFYLKLTINLFSIYGSLLLEMSDAKDILCEAGKGADSQPAPAPTNNIVSSSHEMNFM